MTQQGDSGATSHLTWEVALPQRASRGIGQRPESACVRVSSEAHGTEELWVPVAVGRKLEAGQKSGEVCPTSRNELLYVMGELSRSCGRARIEALVNRRDYSRQELSQKLRQDGYSPQVVEDLVERAVDSGLVDDARFADAFIRSKLSAGWGREKIGCELERRGIPQDEVEGWPEEYLPEEDERERALGLARRRRLTGKNDFQKMVRFLCGRGFAMGLACDVARQVVDEAEGGEEGESAF